VRQRPIGVFDSGVGGLTVTRALIDLLPNERLVYVGDTARYPYGPRPMEEVRSFSLEIADYLVERERVKMLVVACNTAASAGLRDLQARFRVPVVGVIEPGLRAAARVSENQRIGVIGTVGTISSGAYEKAAAALGITAEVHGLACPGFVELVERGELEGPEARRLVEERLAPLRSCSIDTLLLGCTHYPFLARTIGTVMGRDVVLVSSAEETAFEVREVLRESGLAAVRPPEGPHRFLSSGDAAQFASLGGRLLGPELARAERIDFGDPQLRSLPAHHGLPPR